MKKILVSYICIIALICSIIGVQPIVVKAAVYSGTCGSNLTWTLDTGTGVFEISGEGSMYTSDGYSGTPWYSHKGGIVSIVISEGVTNVGNYAFMECKKLKSVQLPKSITSIGKRAFYYCDKLESIEMSDSIRYISDESFSLCYKLANIDMPKELIGIGNNAFYGCRDITNIKLPQGVTDIGDSAFASCSNLNSIEFSEALKNIGKSAFAECTSLINVQIPDSVENIGTYAFSKCSGMTSIKLPNGLRYLRQRMLQGCSSLTSLELPESITQIEEGAIAGCSSLTKLKIPDDVWSIDKYAFASCSGLTSIELPEDITEIKSHAFANCSSLTSVKVPQNVKTIGENAFSGCTSLISIDLPIVLKTIENSAFSGCSSLTIINLPLCLSSIGINVFFDCTKLTNIEVDSKNTNFISLDNVLFDKEMTELILCPMSMETDAYVIPEGVVSIRDYAFYCCTDIKSIEMPNSLKTIGIYSFANCNSMVDLEVPEGVISIGKYAFSRCTSLTSVVLPSSITRLPTYLFQECTSLKDVILPDELEYIDGAAFSSCSSLVSINLPEGIISIGSATFFNCTNLRNIKLPDGIKNMGHSMFQGCSSLTSVKLPNNLEYLGDYSFSDCSKLTYIEIPENVTYIGQYAFCNCINLKSIEIPKNVTELKEYTFYLCSSLSEIKLYEGLRTIEASTFNGCSSLTKVELPNSITSIERQAFYECISLKEIKLSENLTNMGDSIFYECSSLISIELPKGIKTLETNMFGNCSSLTTVKLSEGTTTIESDIFTGCSSLYAIYIPISVKNIDKDIIDHNVHVFYPGSESDWNKIDIDSWRNNYIEESTKHFNFTGDEMYVDGKCVVCNVENAKTYQVTGILFQEDAGDGRIDLLYNEQDLMNSSYVYNHNFAKFAAGLSTIMYNKDAQHMANVLYGLGFEQENMRFEPDFGGKTSPYYIAHKSINLDNKKTDVILVAIRGTYNEEWIDNFDPGYGTETHKGFLNAANHVYTGIDTYMKLKGLGDGETKIMVTGHSRGAAVANLVGKMLNDDMTNISDENIFVYTFATPNATSDVNRSNKKYSNIFNIVNPEDFVTKVMFSAWGFGRYGITYVLPSSTTDPYWIKYGNYVCYEKYEKELANLFAQYRPKDEVGYKPYLYGMEDVSNYVKYITCNVSSSKKYYTKSLFTNLDFGSTYEPYSLKSLYTLFLGYYKSGNEQYKWISYKKILDALSGEWGDVGRITVGYFFSHQLLKPSFSCAHYTETYLAAMNIITEEELKQSRSTLRGIVNCPVDITIKDSNGKILGQIIDNKVEQPTRNEVILNVEGDSKTFTIPKGVEYIIELTGNDEGYMDYSICEMDSDTGEVARNYYNDVPVEDGVMYVQNIDANTDVISSQLYDENGDVIDSTEAFNSKTVKKLSVDVTVEGVGSADSYTNIIPGDYVNLRAYTDENNRFIGWYNNEGKLICEEAVYGISVSENVKITAKFSDVRVPVSNIVFENAKIVMDVGESTINNATVVPSNATNKYIKYTSSDSNVAVVEDYGLIHAVGNGKTTIVATSEDGTVTAVATVIVGEYVDEEITTESNEEPTTEVEPTTESNEEPTTEAEPTTDLEEEITTEEVTSVREEMTTKEVEESEVLTTKMDNTDSNSNITTVDVMNKETTSAIKPKSTKIKKVKKAKKALKVSWKKGKKITGYQLQYSTSKKFKKAKKVTIKKASKTEKVIKRLKAKKKYYVRIRTYKVIKGKKHYSKWSKAKSAKTK